MADAGEALGIALANHIASWDPSKVLLLAEDVDWMEHIFPHVEATIARALPAALKNDVVVSLRQAEPDLYMRGTLALALDHILRRPDLGRTAD